MTFKSTYVSSLTKLCLSAVFVGLTACSTATPTHGNVFEENKFQISEQIERLELYPQVNGLQLNPRDQEAVNRFIRDFSRNGDGQIFMNVPSNQTNSIGAQQAQKLINTVLRQSGNGGANVQTGQYQVHQAAPAPVVISYRKFATLIPRCNTKQDFRLTGNNQAYRGFGCSHFANQAALIGDHRQILRPADQTPADATRRSAVYESYIEGADPSSANGSRQGITFGN
ncbi:MAG: CpaD family pilus assembly lipoprotein [Maricaulaceae bacterium]